MTNTPTESEFDKELREILDNHRFDQEWINTKHENHEGASEHVNTCIVCNKMETISRQNIEAIKQAVDKHVIGEDNLICETYPEKNGTYCNKCKHCRVRNNDEFINGYEYKAEMSRKALHGGDKK